MRRYGGISEGSVCVCVCEEISMEELVKGVCVRRYGGISEGSVCEEIWGN